MSSYVDLEILINVILLSFFHGLYCLYKARYVYMKPKADYRAVVLTALYTSMFFATLIPAHYLFGIISYDAQIRMDTILWCCNFVFAVKLYGLFGGLTIKEIIGFWKVFFKALCKRNFSELRDEIYYPFTLKRIVEYAKRNRSNGYIKKEMDVVLNLIDTVTYMAKESTLSQKDWSQFNEARVQEFLADMGKETKRYYGLINHVKIGKREIEAFNSLLDSLTPSYDNQLKDILMDDGYTDKQRRDRVLSALDDFGSDIKRELTVLVERNEEKKI